MNSQQEASFEKAKSGLKLSAGSINNVSGQDSKTKPSGAFSMNQFQVFPAADEFQLDLVDILADDLTLHLAGNGFLKGGKVGLEQFFQ